MADINSIQQLAKSLNLFHIADGSVDLHTESLSNLDYLEYVLRAESNMRLQSRAARLKRRSKLPQKQYDDTVLNSGQLWQIEQLETMEWTSSFQNLLIIGKCATGKTSLAVRIGEKAINSGIQTYYSTADNFITVIRNTEKLPKADSIFNYMKNSDLIIIDELFYTDYTREELHLLYRGLMFLNETRSIIFVTNREVSSWTDASEDRHLMQTLTDRILSGSQILRL